MAKQIHVKGLVQGVGFRPFVYRIAQSMGLKGWVQNRVDGIWIHLENTDSSLDSFLTRLQVEVPKPAKITCIDQFDVPAQNCCSFEILESQNNQGASTQVSPDLAVCQDCLEDMKTMRNRINYSFTNCTHCGPRFSIIRELPYDRAQTTMQAFTMCPSCMQEYDDPQSRRFHAQPNACLDCGPNYTLYKSTGENLSVITDIVNQTRQILLSSEVVAMKGIGGYHLVCSALDEKAVSYLRKSKVRENKPFAVMFPSLSILKQFATVNVDEERLLTSSFAPIVILNKINQMAASVTQGLNTIGAILPYMPFHHLLFNESFQIPLVLTSGNVADEPIVISNDEAYLKFNDKYTAVITHNRDIYNRCDDSVVLVNDNIPMIIRRARGYVPEPIALNVDVEGIVATGAEQKNTFAVGKAYEAILSQHIGDLKNEDTLGFFKESIQRFQELFRVQPILTVCDLHPDYLSTRFAQSLKLPILRIQHHYAHVASVMAEHKLSGPVIGVAMDGTGYGDDGRIWGGEFLVADYLGYTRYAHLDYFPMPGSELVVTEPWRMALSLLWKAFGDKLFCLKLPLFDVVSDRECKILIQAMVNGVNSPLTSSMGRLFDGVSSILGLQQKVSFEAEAAIRLEALVEISANYIPYSFELSGSQINVLLMIQELVDDFLKGVPLPIISGRFHETIVAIIERTIAMISTKTSIKQVVFSGGSFQNRYLFLKLKQNLERAGFAVFHNELVPCNDGGIALGQIAIAGYRRKIGAVL